MSKKLTLALIGGALCAVANGAPISPDAALARLGTSGLQKIVSSNSAGLQLAHTTRLENGRAAAYIFTKSDNSGFFILSADDQAVPVLGYSETGTIDVNNLPPSLVWWLESQGQRIESGVNAGIRSLAQQYAPSDMVAIAPLLKTTWDQGSPYNQETPVVSGTQAPTGCVATSFAQVMNYFKYPEKGQGSIRYASNGKYLSMNFNKKFDWENMLDSYTSGYTDEQVAAVSYLMKACGYSVEMNYGRYASGAISYKLANAAISYFKYDEGTYYTERDFYSLDQWTRLIYDNIKNVGPVIYDGRSITGGHSFVCDGYDGNGYFHFNWGWGGMSDGYYVLDSLNPENQGIGGAEGGFNSGQGALLGMQPPTGDPSSVRYGNMRIYGTATAALTGNEVVFSAHGSTYEGWGSGTFTDIRVSIGAIITNLAGGSEKIDVPGVMRNSGNDSEVITIGAVSYFPAASNHPVISIPELADGEYKVTLASKDLNYEDAPWQPMICNWGDVNYCLLTIKDGVKIVTSVNPSALTIENCKFISPLYMSRNAKISATFANESDQQLTLCYSPVLYRDGAIQYESDNMLVTVDPGQTVEKEAFVIFSLAEGATSYGLGTYTLKLLDRVTGEIIGSYGDYELGSVSSNTVLNVEDFSVLDATQENVTVGTREFEDAYKVAEAKDIKLHLDFEVAQGYFDVAYKINGARFNPETKKFDTFAEDLYSSQPLLGEGETLDVVIPLNLDAYPAGDVYRIAGVYKNGGTNKSLGTLYVVFGHSGITVISPDNENEVRYFNPQGVPVSAPEKGQLLIRVCGDKVEKVIL